MAPQDGGDNVVFIFSDQQRRDGLGGYGNEFVETSDLDELADGGVRFNNGCTPRPTF